MTMQLIELEQGSDEWLEYRLTQLCASEAPAVMNESKYMTRNQLLDLKKGWQQEPLSKFKEALFRRGHLHEAQARDILEDDIMECLPATCGSRVVDGLEFYASFDGFGSIIFEHKDFNKELAANVRNGVLTGHYYWQLEHQCLVADKDEVTFVVSDGTEENWVQMVYKSDADRQLKLIAAWKQFLTDLESHTLEAKPEVVIDDDETEFPVVTYSVTGSVITTNAVDVRQSIANKAKEIMAKSPESDQDFANYEVIGKKAKLSRAKIKESIEKAKSEFESFADFSKSMAEIDSTLQKLQSYCEKEVKQGKEKKKAEIQQKGKDAVLSYVNDLQKDLGKLQLSSVLSEAGINEPDFTSAMKNKRNIESIINAVDSVVADHKIQIDALMPDIRLNLEWLKTNAHRYRQLFADINRIIATGHEAFVAIAKNRVSEFEEEQEKAKQAKQEEADRKAEAQAAVKEPGPEPKPRAEVKSEPTIQEPKAEADPFPGGKEISTCSVNVKAWDTGKHFQIMIVKDGKESTAKIGYEDGPATINEVLMQLGRTIMNQSKNDG